MTDPAADIFEGLETPRLLLDHDRLERNCAAMWERCDSLGVQLRPHLKTAKSLDVARLATRGPNCPVTVSTLREAAYFARGGYRDILYAVAIAPNKFSAVARVQRETGAEIMLITDSPGLVTAAAAFAAREDVRLSFLIEIDCGESRGGMAPDDGSLVPLARAIHEAPGLAFRGVMTHAGHSYATDDIAAVKVIAARERDGIVAAAETVRAAGLPCGIVSLGSSPTVMFADHVRGVTDVRCGIYMFWDLSQLSRHICREEEIAVSVLSCVIGHNRKAGHLVIDAGALALSKDVGANRFLPDSGFGYVCDAATMARCGDLAVDVVHQEHGSVTVRDPAWFDRLPVGSLVRVLPQHACITAAAYDRYDILRGGRIDGSWSRVNGW